MSEPSQSTADTLDEIVGAVASETGKSPTSDRYPCLLRVGDDWKSYPFEWEILQNLAGSIRWPESAPPIVLVSSDEARSAPLPGTFAEPHPHLRIGVSPALPAATILDAWIAQFPSQVPPMVEPRGWVLEKLGLKPADVAPETRRFLGLEMSATAGATVSLSATLQGVAGELGTSPVTAFAIAEPLQKRHREYASHRMERLSLQAPDGAASHPWEVWRDSVANLYDAARIGESQHRVMDGRLFLVGLGLLDNPLRGAMDAAQIWAPLLLEIDEAAVAPSGPLREALNAVQLAHGYESDRPDGDDQLGIKGEVNALCEVIMDPDVAPPLAVGLFGAWGSGKSFFMEKMRVRVHELTSGASANRPQNVVQIRFNAWHYSDTSLWASLAVEIFERLVDPEPIGRNERERWLRARGDPKRADRERLLTNLETYREANAALEREKSSLEQEQGRLERQRTAAKSARRTKLSSTSLTNVAAELAKDHEVMARLEAIKEALGLTPAVDQISRVARELGTTSARGAAVWRMVRNKTWTLGLLATALAFLVITVAAQLLGEDTWLNGLIPAAASVASLLVAFSKQILPAARKVNQGLEKLHAAIEKVSEVRERLAATRSGEERELELALAENDEQITEATRGIAALKEKIASVAAQAEALSVGRRLYDYLTDRAAGYQKHQGVVGMLHRDFRLLDAQLRAQGASPDPGGLPRIERVVLYIDDLDRCSPAKVLEVLEAVHLLLALELFIVVVGVDPRWLLRSLRHQYRDLCLGEDPTRDPYLHAMPTEYLEKIFQIPLTLPAMETKAYGKLIASLAPGTALPTATPSPEAPSGSKRRASSPESPGGTRAPTRALLEVQAGSAAAGSAGTSIDLTSDEVRFVQELGGLVDTPRAAKRLMNTYRLIRATQHVGSRSRFLGADGRPGEYFAVLILLAVAAGYPTLADRVLVALEDAPQHKEIGTWQKFLDALVPNQGVLAPADIVNPDREDLLSQSAAAEWDNMLQGLQASLEKNRLAELEPYRRWGRTVARFSFTL